MQITAQSYIGGFGSHAQRAAEKWLEDNLVHFFATDAHDVKYRPPLLSTCHAKLIEVQGEEVAERLLTRNQEAVINGKALPPCPEPVAPKASAPKRKFLDFLRRS